MLRYDPSTTLLDAHFVKPGMNTHRPGEGEDMSHQLTRVTMLTTNPTSSSFVRRMRCNPHRGPGLRSSFALPTQRGRAMRQIRRLWRITESKGRSGCDACARARSPGRYSDVPGRALASQAGTGCIAGCNRDSKLVWEVRASQ